MTCNEVLYVVEQRPANGVYIRFDWFGGMLPRFVSKKRDRNWWFRMADKVLSTAQLGDRPTVILDNRIRELPLVYFAEACCERDGREWFAVQAPEIAGLTPPLDYPARWEYWRIEYASTPGEYRYHYAGTEQEVRAWAQDHLGKTLADIGRVQVWNGERWQ